MNSLVILETLRVWQQYNMTFTQFVSFVSSREPPIEPHMSDQQFLRCLHLVDKEQASDITYCTAKCKNISCPRHSSRATKVVSWADFSKTCANYKRK